MGSNQARQQQIKHIDSPGCRGGVNLSTITPPSLALTFSFSPPLCSCLHHVSTHSVRRHLSGFCYSLWRPSKHFDSFFALFYREPFHADFLTLEAEDLRSVSFVCFPVFLSEDLHFQREDSERTHSAQPGGSVCVRGRQPRWQGRNQNLLVPDQLLVCRFIWGCTADRFYNPRLHYVHQF